MITRRQFLDLTWKAAAATPFAAMIPRWYGTAAQWALHGKEGVMRLARAGRLVTVPPSALSRHPLPVGFVSYQTPGFGFIRSTGWLGHWQDGHGRILAWVDRHGQAWWARP